MKYIPIEEVQEGMVCNQTVYNDRGTLLIDRGAVSIKRTLKALKNLILSGSRSRKRRLRRQPRQQRTYLKLLLAWLHSK